MERHYVGRVDETGFRTPERYKPHSGGYGRLTLVDHNTRPSAVHTGLDLVEIQPGGYLNPVVHSFEKGFYVLRGSIVLTVDGRSARLPKDYYGLIPIGSTYSMYNAGAEPARLLEMMAPQPKPEDGNFQDTYFQRNGDVIQEAEIADLGDPRIARHLGLFEESQIPDAGQIAAVGARGGSIHGVSIKEFIDRMLGAEHLAMFLVQFRPGGMGTQHDHPLEETYFFLSGEAEAVLDGRTYRVRAGDYVWNGVGCMHSFENVGDTPVRWIETQAPLPTPSQAFRFRREWEPLARKVEGA